MDVVLPITLFVDNVGAIFLECNDGCKRYRNVDIKHNYIRHFVDKGIVKIIFVRSKGNRDDGYMKNLNLEAYTDNQSDSMCHEN